MQTPTLGDLDAAYNTGTSRHGHTPEQILEAWKQGRPLRRRDAVAARGTGGSAVPEDPCKLCRSREHMCAP
jgi:hypothetical protein